jgi:hypothetical protein
VGSGGAVDEFTEDVGVGRAACGYFHHLSELANCENQGNRSTDEGYAAYLSGDGANQ